MIATVFIAPRDCFSDDETIYQKSDFVESIKPFLEDHCFDCHSDGTNEGGIAFDELLESNDKDLTAKTWHRALKQVRANLMPPIDELQPDKNQIEQLESWIIRQPLGLDPSQPNPGSLTIRRLNRVEYRNTIRDLLGVDFDTALKFPADDTGHGFDNIGDVLSVSPLLLEKYFDAAEDIIGSTVPTTSKIVRETQIRGREFEQKPPREDRITRRGSLKLSYYESTAAKSDLEIALDGDYQLSLNLFAGEDYVDNVFDLNECELRFLFDGEELLKRKFARHGGKNFEFEFDRKLKKGRHTIEVFVKPVSDTEQVRNLELLLSSFSVKGPMAVEHHVKPEGYDHHFPRSVPDDAAAKRQYAIELLGKFAERAFRRPVENETLQRLADLAEFTYQQEGETFESGISKGMTAILASPRFVFREEFALQSDKSQFPLIDEYSLASRLSYFLWSSMPDDELVTLAKEGKLRANLDAQVARMLADERSSNLTKNFAGQWLQARSIESVPIDARSIARRDAKPEPELDKKRDRFRLLSRKGSDRTESETEEYEDLRSQFRTLFRRPRIDFDGTIRRAMRAETEMSLDYILKNDRSLLELLDSNYTFLNESLAKLYQIDGVEGREMRRVELPADSVRGGILTQGTILAVTSNPNRTSPVKRGLFVLENLLGTPTSAPPPDIPALEDITEDEEKKLSLRESLELHRKDPNCSSCHNRMDPLGLALENFNAMGKFRTEELGQSINSKGVLITGESFDNIGELKKILATNRKTDFYRCVTEKMLTYALGRSVEHEDIPVVDEIVDKLESKQGRATELIYGIVKSAAFQRTAKSETEESND
ncbi:MAG: DUF1592 domain-containing protein [Mariniblastus sp.]